MSKLETKGIFKHGLTSVSAKYETQLTPAYWTLIMGDFTFLVQVPLVASILFVNLCPGYDLGFIAPINSDLPFFLIFLVNLASRAAWMFLWDAEYILGAVVAQTVTAASCFLALFELYPKVDISRMQVVGERYDRVFCIGHLLASFNSLALYGTWSALNAVLNMGSFLAYCLTPPMDQDTTAVLCLAVTFMLLCIYLAKDVSKMELYSRFTYSPYVMFICTLAGILSKNWKPDQSTFVIVTAFTVLGVFGLFMKLLLSIKVQMLHCPKEGEGPTAGNEAGPSESINQVLQAYVTVVPAWNSPSKKEREDRSVLQA
ncbi:hypothetical protein ACOMHN_037820 [Nucella lapillus]